MADAMNPPAVCFVCGQGEMYERVSRRGKLFYSCNRYPECKSVAWDKPGGFIGRGALLKAREQGPPRQRVVTGPRRGLRRLRYPRPRHRAGRVPQAAPGPAPGRGPGTVPGPSAEPHVPPAPRPP